MALDPRAQLIQQRDHDRIVDDAQGPVVPHLDGRVPVAEMPGEPRQVGGIAGARVAHWLRCCPYADDAVVRQRQTIALPETLGARQIEKESLAVVIVEQDAAPMTIGVIEGHGRHFLLPQPTSRREHGDGAARRQKRKYRCAIGSTEAGSQTSSSPSARTW